MEAVTVAKAVAAVVQNRDKIGKIVAAIAAIVLTPILLIIALFLYIMSAFAPDGVLKSPEYFTGTDSAIYSVIQEVTAPYYEEVKQEMIDRRKEIIRDNTYEYEITDENGDKKTITVIPNVKRKLNHVPENLIIAYLVMIDGIDMQSAAIDVNGLKNFLENICYLEETEQGNNTFLIENRVLSVDEIANLYFQDETKKTMFTVMCNAYGEYFDVGETKVTVDESNETIETYYPANISRVPLYLQYDSEWGKTAYGNGTIKRNGCCPTCLAMVFSYLCQQNIYPTDVVAWAGNTYYVNGAGTAWSIFYPAAEQWGVSCTNIGKDEDAMIEALSSGNLIIASMGPGTFTKGGHFIVLTGITESGGIKVNDPNDSSSKLHSKKEFDINLILRECKNMWVFGR